MAQPTLHVVSVSGGDHSVWQAHLDVSTMVRTPPVYAGGVTIDVHTGTLTRPV